MVKRLKQPRKKENRTMKTEELKAQGLTDEQIAYVMAENGKSIANAKKEAEDAKAELNKWKKQAEDAQKVLEGFDGVDVDKLKKDVETFKKQAEDAEKTFKQQLADRDFNDALTNAIRDNKGLNIKAIMANLDVETLKNSKNQNEDIKTAIEALKTQEDCKMLFEAQTEAKPKPTFTKPMGKPEGEKTYTKSDIMAVKDRSERRKLIAENMDVFTK